jgi:endonuclease/exonuclease/phosphatase family metal-dependent hydrolase
VPSLRLLSIDARSFGRDRAALARAIASAEIDVACVHGAPHLLRWRSICAAIGRRSGLVVATGGRLAGSNLLLSTLGVDVTAVRDLRFTGTSGLTPPGAALAALRLRGADFVLTSASLAGNAAERLAQARELQAAIDGLVPGRPPAVISAEGADRPGTAAWQALVENGVGVAGRIFVDGSLDVDEAVEVGHRPMGGQAIVVRLTL